MHVNTVLLVLWCTIASLGECSISSSNQFYVVFPKMLRSDSDGVVWVHRQSNTVDETDTIALQGVLEVMNVSQTDITTTVVTKEFQLTSNTRKISMFLPTRLTLTVKLRVRLTHSLEGEVFSRETTVKVRPAERMVFVQTDKPLYKPGDQVRFRIVSVRTDTLTESAQVRAGNTAYFQLIDVVKPSQRSIVKWNKVTWQRGFEGVDFRLPTDTRIIEFGFYKIKVTLQSGEAVESQFEVKKYVLPIFNVELTPPRYILVNDESLNFTVCAKYTFGKPVLGNAKAEVCQARTICRTTTLKLEQDGCAQFSLTHLQYAEEQSFSPRNFRYPNTFSFKATVFEAETGKFLQTKGASDVNIIDRPFNLKATSSEYFWPGLPYLGQVIATRHDGTPFPNPRVRISLRESWWVGNRRWGFEIVKVGDMDGKIDFQLPILPSTMKTLFITFHSEDYKEQLSSNNLRYNTMNEAYTTLTLKKRSTPSGSALRAEVKEVTKNEANCDVRLKLQLTSNVPLSDRNIHVQLSSRGQVVLWQSAAPLTATNSMQSCKNQDGLYGHYECTESGKASCLTGWTGSDCLAPICQGGCLNDGACVSPNKCKCSDGFAGRNCQTCVKRQGCLNGRCIGSRSCVCYYPFSGYNCNIRQTDFNWIQNPHGPGNDRTNRSEWNLQEQDDAIGSLEPTLKADTVLLKEIEPQEITINFRTFDVPLKFDNGERIVGSGARLVVFTVNNDGEMLADSLHLNELTTCLENDATEAKFELENVQPSRQLDLILRSTGRDIQCALSASDLGLTALADENVNAPSRSNLLQKIHTLQNEVYHSTASLYDDKNYCEQFFTTRTPTTTTKATTNRWRHQPRFIFSSAYMDSSFSFSDAGMILLTNQRLRTAPCLKEEVMMFREFGSKVLYSQARKLSKSSTDRKGGSTQLDELQTKIREFFPESWLWSTFSLNSNEQPLRMRVTAPDSITSWRTDLVCVSSAGLGIAPSTKLTVFQPFFLQVSLPYSVVRGELVRLPVSVHSYSKACYQIDITFITKDLSSVVAVDGSERQLCMCSSEKPKITTTFNLRFQVSQNQSILFHASAKPASAFCDGNNRLQKDSSTVFGATDAVKHYINVVPEGVPESATQSALLCGKRNRAEKIKFELRTPENFVPLSLARYISWTADILGPSISNLANLVQMPYGCGEQNLATMVPSIFVLKYLEATSSGSDELKTKALDYIEKGYQRQLQYQHPDGSFSAFGTRDAAGSTWLTAFVVRSFYEASQFYPNVNVNGILTKAVNYLLSQQNQISGCFDERGRVLSSYMQGGVGQNTNLALTAYVLPALAAHFKKNQEDHLRIAAAQNLGVKCLSDRNFVSQSNYLLALGTYALVDIPEYENLLTMGRTKIRQNLQGNYNEKFLPDSGRVEPIRSSNTWWRPTRTSVDVETTAYALLSLHDEGGDLSSNLPLVRWLTAQRNAFGGWRSTQDTVVSLRALSVFGATLAQGYSGAAINLNIKINVETPSTSSVISYDVNEDNRLVEQIRKLEPSSRRITVEAKGVGCVVLVANTVFNLPAPIRPEAPFTLTLKTFTKPGRCEERKLQLAVKYNGAENESGMALLRIRLPTGWYTEQSEESRLLTKYRQDGLKRVEMDGQTVEIYLDSISKANVQLYEVIMKRKFVVKDLKPSVVTVADYYRPELNKEVMLIIADCEEAAKINVEPPAPTPRPNSPPSCPVCSLNNLDTTLAKNSKTIADLLCSKWSAFVLTKRIQNQGRNGYKILRSDDNGTVVIWEVFSLELPPSCHKNCPLLNETIVPDELFFISRYSYRGGIWPGSVQLAPNSDFLIVDADTSFNLEDKIPTDCAGRKNLLSFIAIQKRRRAELDAINRAKKSSVGCPLCFHPKLKDVEKTEAKNRYCAAYLKTGSTFSYNRLFTLKSVVTNAGNDKYFELGTIGSTETSRINFMFQESCRCSLLNVGAKSGQLFYMVPPKGWRPTSLLKLDKRFLFISARQSNIFSSSCTTKIRQKTSPKTDFQRTTTIASVEGSGEGSGEGLQNTLFI